MNRHPVRWSGLILGWIFLTIASSWAVWEQDLLTQQQFSYTVSGVLIVLGSLGVIATFWRPTPRPAPNHPTLDNPEEDHEATDSQP